VPPGTSIVSVRNTAVFLHLCRTLDCGRTSTDCHVSPSTLTRTIQRLEAPAGTRLFDRGPRGVALTAEGHRFRGYARQALELWQDYRAAGPVPAGLTGSLSVFATVTACQTLLPDLLAPFQAAHPDVRMDLRTGDAAAALARRRDPARAPDIAAEPDGHEALLALVVLGYGTGVVPRLVLDTSVVRDRLAVVPTDPMPPFTIGLCVCRADLRRPIVAALWSLARGAA
jgi:LysR family positive regulator for ilvC